MAYGRQWIDWNPILRKWTHRAPYRDRTVTLNHLRGRVESRVARLTMQRPNFSVVPNSYDLTSKRAAKLAEKLLEFDWANLNMHLARYIATLHETLFGCGIIKVVWDKNGGKVTPNYGHYIDDTGEEIPQEKLEEAGARLVSYEREGEFRVEAIHPAQMHVPPGVMYPMTDLCPWMIHEYGMTREEIKQNFGVELQDVQSKGSGDFAESISQDIHRFTYQQWMSEGGQSGKVRVLEYYEPPAPHTNYDRGRCFIVADGKVLNRGEEDSYPGEPSQFFDGRYPFFLFPSLPEPGRFWPRAWLSDQVDPQVSYNQTRARMRQWEALLFAPYILNPNTSGIPDPWFAGGYKVLTYQPHGGKPEFWSPPPVPSEAYRSLDRDITDMDMIGQQFGFSRGQTQQGSPSAALAQLMVESDSSELGPIMSIHARSWEKLGHALLELRRRYGKPQDMIRLMGVRGTPEVLSFKRSDIPANLLVRVQEDSLQPQIKAVRIETARNLVREGFYGNPAELPSATRQKLLENMGQPVGRFGVDDPAMAERAYAELENYHLVEGKADVPVRPGIENDEIHLAVHLERCNEPDAMEWDVEVVGRMQKHIKGHRDNLMKAQADAMKAKIDEARALRSVEVEGDIRTNMFEKASAKLGGETSEKPTPKNGEPKKEKAVT